MVEINWRPDGGLYAFVLFNTISQAEEARNQMRGRHLKNSPSERLRIDFVDPKKFKPVNSRSPPPPPHGKPDRQTLNWKPNFCAG